jgi:iduronate 2-sulfatase
MRISPFLLLVFVILGSIVHAADKPNILFIAVDDLRPQMGAYGKTFMKTPNLDRLAASGVLFERAYCMVPTCGASRAALMTSIRPAHNRFVGFDAYAQKDAPRAITLNTHFKSHGYTTISLGKIFHNRDDNAQGWSEEPWLSDKNLYQDSVAAKAASVPEQQKKSAHILGKGRAFERSNAPEENFVDHDLATKAISYLDKFSQSPSEQSPFFLAVGFIKPHLPFSAPQKYWDMYDANAIDLPDNDYPPKDAPPGAVHNSAELRTYVDIPKGKISKELARELIHGYYACVSFADAQIGRVLDALERNGLAKNTIVVLWGDHGWQLGEHGMWNKHSCFETSMHAPLIMRVPHDHTIKPGTRIAALTEFIDIYPTLCELSGLPIPTQVQGTSTVPLLKNPQAPWKSFAVGRFGAGDTIRSDHFRYSEYRDKTGNVTGEMLYDHRTDAGENTNIVNGHAKTPELNKKLQEIKGK